MGQVLHGCAATTEAVRRAIQGSQASLRAHQSAHEEFRAAKSYALMRYSMIDISASASPSRMRGSEGA
jgi:hypothetical protein